MTKREMFATIKAMVEGIEMDGLISFDGLECSYEDIKAFCDHEMELLSKKSSGSSKPTKTQIENESYKSIILDILAENDRPMTISEMMEDERLSGLKNQRVSALVTFLKKAQVITRNEIKRKAYFSLTE